MLVNGVADPLFYVTPAQVNFEMLAKAIGLSNGVRDRDGMEAVGLEAVVLVSVEVKTVRDTTTISLRRHSLRTSKDRG